MSEHMSLAELTEARRRSDRLADAAPDLLAALKELRDHTFGSATIGEPECTNPGCEVCQLEAQVTAAIRRAEGGGSE